MWIWPSVDVQNRVNQALGRLPAAVKNTGVIITKQTSGFVFGAGVYSENGQYDSLFLSNYMDVYVRDALKRVPGVGDVIVFGERKYAMRLWLDPREIGAARLDGHDLVECAAGAEHSGGGGGGRAAAGGERAIVSGQRAGHRAADRRIGIRQYYFKNWDGRHAGAPERRGARGTGRGRLQLGFAV